MPTTILAIGLEPALLNQLTKGSACNLVTAQSFQEAIPLLTTAEVSSVLIDSQSSSQLRSDINLLLADTPVTTSIVLILHPTDFVSAESYSALGVKTLESPVSSDALTEVLA